MKSDESGSGADEAYRMEWTGSYYPPHSLCTCVVRCVRVCVSVVLRPRHCVRLGVRRAAASAVVRRWRCDRRENRSHSNDDEEDEGDDRLKKDKTTTKEAGRDGTGQQIRNFNNKSVT